MNCEQIREQLVETARGRELSSDLRAIVFQHASRCDDCAQRLDVEQQLTQALADLAFEDVAAPMRVEHAIRQALPVSIRKPASVPFWHWVDWKWAAPALAASLMISAFVFHPVTRQPPPVVATAALDSADSDGFTTLPYAEDLQPGEQADVVQVQLTRGSLLAMGVPVSGEQLSDQVQAEVLLGVDGTPRAVRLAD